MIVSMNSAEKRINKEIAKTVARRSSQGWTADKIAARIWLCYGHLCSVRGNVLSVRMAGGVQNFVISQEVYVTYDELPEAWKAVETAAMKYLREMNDENRAEQAEIQIEKQRERS